MTWTMITGGDWRSPTPSSEITKMVSCINSSHVDLFVGLGDYSGNDIHNQITVPKFFLAGNHEGGNCPYCSDNIYIANWNNKNVQIALIGCRDSSECNTGPNQFNWTQIKTTSPALVFMHTNFIDGCSGAHSTKTAIRAKMDAISSIVVGACGHDHNYVLGGGADRIYIQSGVSSAIRYCGPSVFMFGYFLFDDSVPGKLTVKYKGINTQVPFVIPTTWDKQVTVNSGGPAPLTASLLAHPDTIIIGQSTTFTVTTSGGVPPYSYSWTGLPSPLQNANVSEIAGTPETIGTYDVMATVKDSSNSTVTAVDTLVVNDVPPPPVLTSITISPASISVGVGTTVQLVAVCRDQNSNIMTCPTLTWASSDPSKAAVDSTGLLTGISEGTTNITATSGSITSNISTIIVTIAPILTSIAISPTSAPINVNATIQLSSVCKDQNNNTMTCPALTWASSNTAIATVSPSGLVTGVSSGTVSITARSGTITSNLSTITVAAISGSITVTTPSTGLIYSTGESRVVRWTHTSNTGANVKIELLKAGVLSNTISSSTPNDDAFAWTVPSVVSGNDYQIKVTSTTNSQFTGTSGNFTINGTTPILASIAIAPVSASININGTTQLSSVCKDQNSNTMTCPTLIWASSNTAIATVGSSGLVTGVSSGTANITARSGTVTSNTSIVTVAQIAPVLASITISPASASINANTTIQLSSACKDQNNNTMTCPTLIWTSDNTSIATVNSSGLVTGVSAGTANVTAKSGTVTSNLSTITVTAVPEKKFSVFNITPGDTANNVGVLAILDDSGTLTKDQACAEVCTRLGQI